MRGPIIEHVNLTVTNPARTAALMERLFDWHIRWEGPARDGGTSIHVGDERFYIALYAPPGEPEARFPKGEPLNHVGILVDDLDAGRGVRRQQRERVHRRHDQRVQRHDVPVDEREDGVQVHG